jgi:acetylglutamate kinase
MRRRPYSNDVGGDEMRPLHVVKIGGALVDSQDCLSEITSAIARMAVEQSVVVVHGGGPQATRMAKAYGHVPKIVDGRRVTSALDLAIIQATVCGIVNSQLVSALVGAGVSAVGLSGASAETVQVTKRPPWTIRGESVDFGFVGDIDAINPSVLRLLLSEGHTPVVAGVGIDAAGQVYNVNADTTAAAIASAIGADELSIVTDSAGLRHAGETVASCDPDLFERGRQEGWIDGGMLVKLTAGFNASSNGVPTVRIVGSDGLGTTAGTLLAGSPVTAAFS